MIPFMSALRRRNSKKAFTPLCECLEGRQLLSSVTISPEEQLLSGVPTGQEDFREVPQVAPEKLGPGSIITGAGPGGQPHVEAFRGSDNGVIRSFLAYDPHFTGGVTVAYGDVNGDGIPDIITGAGPGGQPHVQVFSGADGSVLRSFLAYDPGFTGGVYVAAGDINGDGRADIITGAGPGGQPHVQVFSGTNNQVIRSFLAYFPGFTGGVYVAAGDINGDGRADIITGAGPGGQPHVQVFSGNNNQVIRSFLAYFPGFTGGVYVAAGDINGDGRADIITGAGPGGEPHVQVFSGIDGSVLRSFLAYARSFTGGVYVAGLTLPSRGLSQSYLALKSEGPSGGPGGSPFGDGEVGDYIRSIYPLPGPILAGSVQIASVTVFSGVYIDSIQVTYAPSEGITGQPGKHGGGGGHPQDLLLQPGEYITEVSGRSGDYVDSLTIRTGGSRSQTMTWGGSGGSRSFDYKALPGSEIVFFWGRSGQYLDAIGVDIASPTSM